MTAPHREPRTLTTADGLTLEAELDRAVDAERVGVALCHPHPQFGGTMRSIVISALFDALPQAGATCLRFNFRGVGASGGVHDEGRGELLDALAAVDCLHRELGGRVPLVLAGWSFGADVALATPDERVAAWLVAAPPLRPARDLSAVARDPRPKLVILGERDEYRDPASVIDEVASWTATETVVIPGASHYFVGRTDQLVDLARAFLARV